MLTVDLKSGLVGVSTMKSLCSSKFDSKGVCLPTKLLHEPRINCLAISCMRDCDMTGVRERERARERHVNPRGFLYCVLFGSVLTITCQEVVAFSRHIHWNHTTDTILSKEGL